jgi:Rieske Fe-S protein
MSDRPVDPTRRRLCQAACGAGALVALSAIPGCGGEDPPVTQASCTSGSPGAGAANLEVGQSRYVESLAVFICRDAGGYYAVDAACPHLGADVEPNTMGGFTCPAHFSTFDLNGKVLTGPALTDLAHWSLCTTSSGLLIVDTQKRVTADTRLVV